ncbi:MAG: TIGR00282 family metallophosphoesterase [Planctomycetota bacterium]|jgi:metallophosphoesterase (TIGR00282 family)
MEFRILFIGDIVGSPGRRAVEAVLPQLLERHSVDFVIANAENAAGGSGLTPEIADDLFAGGIDCLTMGDHVWRRKEIVPRLETDNRILRPANFSEKASGKGYALLEAGNGKQVAVINLLGRIFVNMKGNDPFEAAEKLVTEMALETPLILVDMHAEATSEKIAMGWFLDGRVTAVIGTHTHVQTADEQVLPGGTAYITDTGMTGPYDSVLGRAKEKVVAALTTNMPRHFDVAEGDVRLAGVLITADAESGRAVGIERIMERVQ